MPQIPPLRRKARSPTPGREVVEGISGGVMPEMADAMRAFLGTRPGRQTLIQPAMQSHLFFAEQVPLPTMMIWTPELMPPKRIVPPLPYPATAANVKPSLELPNQEIKLADVAVGRDRPGAAQRGNACEHDLAAGDSLPKPVQMAPATVSPTLEQPTPTAVLSISDVRMPDGTVFLPPVNDVAKSVASAREGSLNNGGGNADGSQAKQCERRSGRHCHRWPAAIQRSHRAAQGWKVQRGGGGQFAGGRISRDAGNLGQSRGVHRLSARGPEQELDPAILADARGGYRPERDACRGWRRRGPTTSRGPTC